MSDFDHVVDDLPALALAALDEVESARVQAHLSACEECRQEWHAYRESVGLLSLAIPPAQPPARLKQSILNHLPQTKTPSPNRSGWFETIRHWLIHPSPSLSLVGLAVILILLASNLFFWQRSQPALSPVKAGYGTVALITENGGRETTGMVVYTLDGESGFLVVNHLPKLPEDQAYQLWLIMDGQRTSGGVFSVDAQGYHVMQIEAPLLLTGYDGFGITIEPAGGSPGPTGPKVLGGSF
jgi:anti-sigma-K factor RskA